MSPKIDHPAPDFDLPATGDTNISLRSLAGKIVVLYFYPRDNTPGCTQEGEDFRDLHAQFQAAGAQILGVSRDSIRKHENFKAKFDFPFPLLADEDETACKAYDVIREKKLYGKPYVGIDRSTFVIDAQGVLRHEWRGVKVKGHAAEVLETVKTL